jgi:hypothetical protein
MNNIKISKPINITKEIFEKFEDGDNGSESIAVCRCPFPLPNIWGTGWGHIVKKDITYVCSECGTEMCCPSVFDYRDIPCYPD